MMITGTGHAGILLATRAGRVLCDPWVGPSFFGSWFPFPDNHALDWDALGDVDYLYVSHTHADHLDPRVLREHVSKQAAVILPPFPSNDLESALRDCGFRTFIRLSPREVREVDGLAMMTDVVVSVTDGPIGDSVLWLDDGEHRVFNQNDARMVDLTGVLELGAVDIHFLQFSGAIWYPMVYDFPAARQHELAEHKRARQLSRALTYIAEVSARWVVPFAGPACFLDPELWHLNDIESDGTRSIFVDQDEFLRSLANHGIDNGVLMLPGSTLNTDDGDLVVSHDTDPHTVFGDKSAYLRQYQRRAEPVLASERQNRQHITADLFSAVRDRLEPPLAASTRIARLVACEVRLVVADDHGAGTDCLIDFVRRRVRPYAGEDCPYEFRLPRTIVEHLLATGEENWTDTLFLSFRFTASRNGPYNEFVYAFFRCLSVERIRLAEKLMRARADDTEDLEKEGWVIQRRCPHLGADLAQFGKVEHDVLTCGMHGWQWNLRNGSCLTGVASRLRARQLPSSTSESADEP
jgi:UDP-MurNAc hydroxylase